MTRIRIVFVLLALGLLIPTGLLVRRSLESVAVEKAARHRTVAERLFDEMERSLSTFLEREEERPVGHYRFYIAAESIPGAARGGRSPLSEPPAEPFVVGYFQIDPDGSVHTPLQPRSEEGSASEGDGAPTPEGERLAQELEGLLEGVFSEIGAGAEGGVDESATTKSEADRVTQAPGSTIVLDDLDLARKNAAPLRDAADGARRAKEEEATPEDAYGAIKSFNRALEQRASRGRKIIEESAPEQLRALGYVGDIVEGAALEALRADLEPQEKADAPVAEDRLALRRSAPGRAESAGASSLATPSEARHEIALLPRAVVESARSPQRGLVSESSDVTSRAQAREVEQGRLRSGYLAPQDSKDSLEAPARADSPAAVGPLPPGKEPKPARPIRVAIDPLIGRVLDADHLLLTRAVFVGDQAFRQGLVLDVPRLTDWLREETVGASGLREARLAFATRFDESAKGGSGPYLYRHRLAEPFHALSAQLSLPALGDLGGEGTIYRLSALLLLAGGLGLLALYRMVGVTVSYAERRSNFVAAVSHELKTPLTAIRMYGEMLRDGIVPNDEKRQEYYETITAESERLSRLINNVLEFSRLEKGNREVNLVAGDIGSVVEELVQLARPHAEREGFSLRVFVEPDLPAVRFDRDALLQVLFNLVDNAIKYASDAADREIRVECRPRGGGVVLAVRDHGPGVAPRHLARVFEPFYRGQEESTRTTKGTGLGLSLVKGLVERMGAGISGRNLPEGGFEVRIAFGDAASRA